MHLPFCCRLHYRLRLLFVALAVFAGTPFQRSFAQDLTFPLSPLRWAQRSETPPAPASPQIGTETLAHTEQQTAVLNLIASNRADVEERSEALAKEKNDWEANLQKLAAEGLADPRPYSFLELDKARDELASETASARAQREAIATAKEAVTLATTKVESKQRDVRRAKDGLEHNADVAAEAALTQAVAEAEHASTVAGQTLELRRAELANFQLEQEVQSLRLNYAQRRLALYQQDVVFTSAMLDTVFAELDARGKAATARAKQLGDDLNKFLQPQWYQARERLDDARVSQDPSKLSALAAEVQAKDLAQQLADHEIGINVTKLDRVGDLRTAWQRRFELANSMVSSSNTAQWLDETKAARERLRADATALNAKSDSIQKQLTSIEKKLQDADASDASLR